MLGRASRGGSGIWSGCLLNVSLWRGFGHAHPGGDPRADQGHAGGIISLGWLGSFRGPPRGVGGSDWGEERLDFPAQAVATATHTPISSRKQMNGRTISNLPLGPNPTPSDTDRYHLLSAKMLCLLSLALNFCLQLSDTTFSNNCQYIMHF